MIDIKTFFNRPGGAVDLAAALGEARAEQGQHVAVLEAARAARQHLLDEGAGDAELDVADGELARAQRQADRLAAAVAHL